MTPMDLRNIHTTGNSCRDAFPCVNMALKLPRYFYLLMEKPLVATSKFGLLTIKWHSATRKHLFLYAQGDRSGFEVPQVLKIATGFENFQESPWISGMPIP